MVVVLEAVAVVAGVVIVVVVVVVVVVCLKIEQRIAKTKAKIKMDLSILVVVVVAVVVVVTVLTCGGIVPGRCITRFGQSTNQRFSISNTPYMNHLGVEVHSHIEDSIYCEQGFGNLLWTFNGVRHSFH